jgi:diguanylate cyclase (GGDEF)-like protein
MRAGIESMELEHAKSKVSDYVSVSVGASSVIPLQGMEPEILISAADQALYKAKEDGRNCVKSSEVTD